MTFSAQLDALGRRNANGVVETVNTVLADGVRRGASDVHFEPTPHALSIRFRIDGVLHDAAAIPRELAPNVVARLKVLSELLTYRVDIPQEGSIRPGSLPCTEDMRVSTFPTVHGEKAVVRIFHSAAEVENLDQLGLHADVRSTLENLLLGRSGAVFLTGPSGSGKTTTIYACLRRLVQCGLGRHIVTIEDPVERWVSGVSQSQARPGTDFDFARGLRSLLRQDPDVIMVGEIRDPETAAVATEAALTGHLVFSTLHAGSSCGVIGRLLEMGVEPYVLTSGVKGILNQRLLRRRCRDCESGCASCAGTGYRGRFLIAELLTMNPALRQAILAKADAEALEAVAADAGVRSIRAAAEAAIADGRTTAEEVVRVLGP